MAFRYPTLLEGEMSMQGSHSIGPILLASRRVILQCPIC